MKKTILFSIFSFFTMTSIGQGIITTRYPNIGAINAIAAPTIGMMVYNNATQSYWYYATTGWTNIAATTAGNQWTSVATDAYYNNTGNVGVGTSTPVNKVHVSNGTSGVTPFSNSDFFLEDDGNTYLQLGSPDGVENGIIFGKGANSTKGYIVLSSSNNDMLFGTNSSTRMRINNDGDIIMNSSSTAKIQIGSGGSGLSEIIRATVSIPAFNLNANTCTGPIVSVPNSALNSSVHVSPDDAMDTGLVIAYARVTSAGNVGIRICNTSSSTANQAAMDYHVTVIR